MTGKEFDQWWTDFKIRFPDMGGPWFADGRNDAQQRVALGGFAEVLRDVTLPEAMAANRELQRTDGVGNRWDRDEIARKVRAKAMASRSPNTWTGPADDPYAQPDRKPLDLGGALRHLVEMREKGAPPEDCEAFLARRFPSESVENQRRYKCLQCFDTGRVEVWHFQRVILAKKSGLDAALQCPNKTTAAACSCKIGEKFGTREKQPLVTYDRTKHCLAKHGDVESAEAIDAFQDWLASHDRPENRANYEAGFANYSQGEAF